MRGTPDSPEAGNEKTDWRVLGILMPYLWEYRGRVIISMAFLVTAKLASVALPLIMKYIVDGLDSNQTDIIVLPLSLLLAYGLLRLGTVLFGELRDAVFGRVTEHAMRRISLQVFKHLHRLDLNFHLSRRTGGLSRDIERGTGGISFLLRFMLFNIIPTLLEISLVAAILLVNYSAWFAIITFGSVVAYIAFSVITTEWRTKYVRQANERDSRANTRAIDSLLNYETVKYFGNEKYEANQYDKNLEHWEESLIKNRLSLATLNSGQALIIAAAVTSMMILAAQHVVDGTMTLGDLVLVNAYMIQMFLPLNFLGFVYREIKRALADMARMFRLLEVNAEVADNPDATSLNIHHPLPGGEGRGEGVNVGVRFENVNFAYRQDRPILRNVSFEIPPGKKLAVVGPSGAGKSTIARLLFRFYDVNEGSIHINGQDIREVTLESLRAAIGVVPQDTVLFNDSIYYNISYGRPEATRAEVIEAARNAHLAEFIERLPDGYDTMVGERGLKLSGGEKQRIAIARTILKNPGILIFDEATSSLDSESEKAILRNLNEIAADRTTLVIAHRLSTIIDADNIVVLDQGRVVEQGRHQELIESDGTYAKLWKLQQQASRTDNVEESPVVLSQ